MWTKNGSETLPLVLKRISEVIPSKFVNKRVIVDDHSSDNTREIAQTFGWTVVFNEGNGISDGANTALAHVETEYFCSFEQDLLLSSDWWSKIPSMLGSKVVVASGMRFASQPEYLAKLQKYVARKYRGEKYLSSWLKAREMASFTLGKTLDNTIYKTSVLRELGGFPRLKTNAGVDTVLAYKMKQAGYTWAVDYTTQSLHLRTSLWDELNHQYFYGTQLVEIWAEVEQLGFKAPMNKFSVLSRLLYAPLTGIFVALKMKEPRLLVVHPLIRLYYAKGLLHGLSNS